METRSGAKVYAMGVHLRDILLESFNCRGGGGVTEQIYAHIAGGIINEDNRVLAAGWGNLLEGADNVAVDDFTESERVFGHEVRNPG
jgi:hypothetical protein